MLKRVRLRATTWGISDSQPRIFRAGGYKGRDLPYPVDYSPLSFVRTGIYTYTHTDTRWYINILIVQPMRACILRDKSASSLCQSAATRFAPVGMRESYRLQGGWRKSFNVRHSRVHSC